MNTEYSQLHRYLASIGVEMIFQAEENLERTCPLSISLCYNATKAVLFDKQRLLLFSHDALSLTPDQVQNHVHILAEVYSLPLLFVFQTGNREFCMSLIKKHLPFIISNRQCYIPDGLIAINEKGFRKTQARKITSLSPIAQVILLYYLLHRELPAALPFQEIIAAIPNLSKVYVTRAAQELSSVGLCTIIRSGHFTHLNFEVSRRELWERAQTFLRSPVLRHIRIENELPNLPLAGINALSEYSNLNNDEVQTVAMYSRDFDKTIPTFEYSGYHLELWRYNPRLLCGDGQSVDKLSLYLSLKDNKDPRVRGELARMMEEFQW
jgi:hypothetical protein